MPGRKIRRKIRKRKPASENSGVKLSLFLGIILLAVGLGFLTARFVIGPLIGYNAGESPAQELTEKPETEKDAAKDAGTEKANADTDADADADTDADAANSADTTDTAAETEEGYALQFGAFSSKEAAQELSDALQAKGIKTHVVEIDHVFKVMSPITEKKETALQDLAKAKDKEITDVFITAVGA